MRTELRLYSPSQSAPFQMGLALDSALGLYGAQEIRKQTVSSRLDPGVVFDKRQTKTSRSNRMAELVPSKLASGSEASSSSGCTVQSAVSPRRTARQTSL